jgi:TRAP-type mannitol/chloroaromatic compound transport system permease large subunit
MGFNEILGLVMLTGMIGVIFLGIPISFTLLFLAFIFGSIGLGPEMTFNLAYLQIWGTMKDDILPAVPLFIFMGYMTEQAGLMERLFLALRHLLAPVRGSLYLAVILTATIFAMATGIVGAAVTVLGIMAGPIMIKTGYNDRLSAGAIAAGGTLGIPERSAGGDGPDLGRPRQLALFGGLRARVSARRALSAYYLRNVVPQWSLSTIYKGMADYMVIQIICLVALMLWPEIALWLPKAVR